MVLSNKNENQQPERWNDRFPELPWDNFQKILKNNLPLDELVYGFKTLDKDSKKLLDIKIHPSIELEYFCLHIDHTSLKQDSPIIALGIDLVPDAKAIMLPNFYLSEKNQATGLMTQYLYNVFQIADALGYSNIYNDTINHSLYAQSKLGYLPITDDRYKPCNTEWSENVAAIQDTYKQLLSSNLIEFKNGSRKKP